MEISSIRGVSLLLILVLLLPGCGPTHGATETSSPTATMVIVSTPVEQEIVDFVDYTGRTDAAESVEIRARVTGFLNTVKFTDGAEIEKGAPLYEIDDREYQADFEAAQATVASTTAHQEKTTTDFKRMEDLRKKGAASAEEFDRVDAAKKEADAAVASATSKRTRAQLNLDFSRIAAPISGKISRSQITAGNLINADATILTTIVSVEPMYVFFDVDERTILALRKQVREGQLESQSYDEIPVRMGLAIDKDYPYQGMIDFIDNRVDPRTGTFRVRGTFKNPRPEHGERPLDPGLFARIRVPIGKPHQALLVTERAIGTDQGQKFVYVVDEKNEIVFRPVRLGARYEGLRVIADGLKAGERIVIDGLQRVRPGSVVDPKPGDMHSRPSGAPANQSASEAKSDSAHDAEHESSQTKSAE